MNKLLTIEEWLKVAFSNRKCLDELYIIGSILTNENCANDVDIIQRIYFEQGGMIDEYIQRLKQIKEEFFITFSKSLHITSFTQNESSHFERFISLNKHLKIL